MSKEQMNMAKTEAQKRSRDKWNRENTVLVSVSVKKDEKEQFRTACEQRSTTMNAVLSGAIRAFLEEDKTTAADIPTGWEQTAPSVLRTLRTPDGWQLDVDDDGRAYGAWLTHSSCSVKVFLAGADKSKHTIDEFTSIILADIDAYKADYRHDYM